MITLSKKERIAIIDKAITRLEKEESFYICTSIACSSFISTSNVFKYFPELLKYKPIEPYKKEIWFNTTKAGTLKRIRILKKVRKNIKLSID